MGQKLQREFLKRGWQLNDQERLGFRSLGLIDSELNALFKVYYIEDVETKQTEFRISKVAEEELK